MEIIGFLLIGLIAGLLARAILPGRDPMGLLGTVVLGCVGALIGGFLFGGTDNAVGWIGATVGAILVLAIYRLVTRDRGRSRMRV